MDSNGGGGGGDKSLPENSICKCEVNGKWNGANLAKADIEKASSSERNETFFFPVASSQ